MYGAGQWRYSYQGHDIIEHGGHNLGYRTQVARVFQTKIWVSSLFPTMKMESLLEAVKFRIADEIRGLNQLDWNDR